jgi:DNA polymerase III subunit epsilon
MTKFEKQKFVCLDCETTGLDPKEDRIIEIACVSFDLGQIYESFETLVDPEREIPEISIAIHHISQKMVAGQPKIHTVLPQVLEIIGSNIIVGHGIQFDIEVVANSCDRAGIPHRLRSNQSLDTLRMARVYGESPINSLEHLRKHFNIEAEIAHRAMSDVIVNIEVFKRLLVGYSNLDHLFKVLSKPILLKEMPLGKHKGRPFKGIPEQYLRWAAHQDFDQDLLFSLRSELKRRKQGNLFSQSANPFQDL